MSSNAKLTLNLPLNLELADPSVIFVGSVVKHLEGITTMSIDRKTVDHAAWLARLALTDEEREALRDQLSGILGHINVISEADTAQVSATAHILPLENVMALDTPWTSLEPQTLLANAPAQEDDYFRVGAILEEE